MAIDRHAYFSRIGYTARADATLDTLRDVVAAHNRSIPFENLDPLMGVPVGDLSVEALTDKLVRRRRGGYCYEHNGLLGYVLPGSVRRWPLDAARLKLVGHSPKMESQLDGVRTSITISDTP